jgi:primosomal protein N' (replication factor Y)
LTEPSLQQVQLAGMAPVAASKCLVLVDEAPDLELWYSVPENFPSCDLRGCRVAVPLRRRKVQGTVIQVSPIEGQEGFALRPISSLIHAKPLVPPALLELAGWMSDYYACRLEVVVRGMIPEMIRTGSGGFKTQKAIRLKKEPLAEDLEALEKKAPRQAAILKQLTPGSTLLLATLSAEHSSAPQAIKRLEEAGWIEVLDEVQSRDPSRAAEYLPSQPLALTE